jgi:hypothetical protein
LVKRVLHHIVRIQVVDPSRNRIHIRLIGIREEEELGPRKRGEALQPKVLGLKHFDPRRRFGA